MPEQNLPSAPTVEERLEEVERKVEFIYRHVASQAAQQLVPQLKAAAEQQVLSQLMEGATRGRNGTGDDQA